MEELGEAAKLWVYLKMFETLIGLIALPFFIWFIYKKVFKRF